MAGFEPLLQSSKSRSRDRAFGNQTDLALNARRKTSDGPTSAQDGQSSHATHVAWITLCRITYMIMFTRPSQRQQGPTASQERSTHSVCEGSTVRSRFPTIQCFGILFQEARRTSESNVPRVRCIHSSCGLPAHHSGRAGRKRREQERRCCYSWWW